MNRIKFLIKQLIAVFTGDITSLVKYARVPNRITNKKHYDIRDGF
ncbi:hypothetical protein [Chryseolinea sp. H1M3-3]|nr:hypothetical protein [Chryseolinea sp. H1M3-3]